MNYSPPGKGANEVYISKQHLEKYVGFSLLSCHLGVAQRKKVGLKGQQCHGSNDSDPVSTKDGNLYKKK